MYLWVKFIHFIWTAGLFCCRFTEVNYLKCMFIVLCMCKKHFDINGVLFTVTRACRCFIESDISWYTMHKNDLIDRWNVKIYKIKMGEFKYICFFIKKKNETWCGGKVLGYELSIYEKRVCKSSCKGDYMMPVNPAPPQT